MKTPVNGTALRQHLTYSWWKYVLVAIAAVFCVNMYYTVTSYRPPEEKKILMYIYGYANQDRLDGYMANVQAEKMPEMEEMRSLVLTTDDSYGAMQLSTYIAASEGDVYVLPRDEFIGLASQGAFLDLETDPALMDLFTKAGLSLQSGWRKNTELEETHLYGIPLNRLPGLSRYLSVENGFVAILFNNQNDENVLHFLRILCEDMIPDPDAAGPAESVSWADSVTLEESPAETSSPESAETAPVSGS